MATNLKLPKMESLTIDQHVYQSIRSDQDLAQHHVHCPLPFSALNSSGGETSQCNEMHIPLPKWDFGPQVAILWKSIQLQFSQFLQLRLGW